MSIYTGLLRGSFLEWSNANVIGGSDIWRRLAQLSRKCIVGHSAEQKAAAFCLYSVFSSLYMQYDETPVTTESAVELKRKLHPPLAAAIDFLDENSTERLAIDLIADLADLMIGVV